MIDFEILARAKAFLCWEKFSDLVVQLVPILKAVGYFLPPEGEFKTIIIFYDEKNGNYAEPLFLLFHEAGHAIQQGRKNKGNDFSEKLDLPNGPEKQQFEAEAWHLGGALFKEFLLVHHLSETLLSQFEKYAETATASYLDTPAEPSR